MNKLLVLLLITALSLLGQTSGRYMSDWRRHVCPDKEDLIFRVKACSQHLNDTNMDKISRCYSLKGSRECMASVFSGCTAYDLLVMELPDNIRYAEREINKEISKCDIF